MERGKKPGGGRRQNAAGRGSFGKRPRKDKPREGGYRGKRDGGKQERDGRGSSRNQRREGGRDRRGREDARGGRTFRKEGRPGREDRRGRAGRDGRAGGERREERSSREGRRSREDGQEQRQRPPPRKHPKGRGASRRDWRDGPAPGASAGPPAKEPPPRQRREVRRKTPPALPPAENVAEAQPPPPLTVLEQRLGHSFADPSLLRRALTHSSASADNYERLEFLGDAALGFVVGRLLFEDLPDATEQRLTLMRSHVVNAAALAEVAEGLELGAFLVLGTGERRGGGAERPSLLGDALEALLGAVLCDGGLNAAGKCVRRLFASRLAAARDAELKDPKTRLQEHLQQRGLPLPQYEIAAAGGLDHAPVYAVECVVEALGVRAKGVAGSRREAEKRAAAQVVAELENAAPAPADDAQPSATDATT